MDDALRKRLERVEQQIGVVYEAEERFRSLEAAKGHVLAKLIASASGSSQSAKTTVAEATPEWGEFVKNLAVAESIFHREKHFLELKNHAFLAEYSSFKIESEAIKRQL